MDDIDKQLNLEQKRVLLDIGQSLSSKEFLDLKYYADDIPDGLMDDVGCSATKLWTLLDKQTLISPGDLTYVEKGLELINRLDLADKIRKFHLKFYTKPKSNFQACNYSEPEKNFNFQASDYNVPEKNVQGIDEKSKEAFNILVEKLGPSEWMELARRIITNCDESIIDRIKEENPRSVKNQIRKMLQYWLDSDNPSLSQQAKILENALRACNNNRLASVIKKHYKLETDL